MNFSYLQTVNVLYNDRSKYTLIGKATGRQASHNFKYVLNYFIADLL
jgi:hypothetical protein